MAADDSQGHPLGREVTFPQTPDEARECVHDVLVWVGHECGFCMDELGRIEWKVPAARQQFVPVDWSMDIGGNEVHRYQPGCEREFTCLRLYVGVDDGDDGGDA